ncbi:phosphoheptose isomerase family protein [Spiroplasma phoeniceum]|nr:hypothetical protein [Spiroplasma phoeniceum]
MNKNYLILAYSLFGDNEAVNKALTIAKEKGVTIVVISGKDMSKAVKLANWSHIISTPNQRVNDHRNILTLINFVKVLYILILVFPFFKEMCFNNCVNKILLN